MYAGDKKKPIPVETVLTLNSTGHVVNAWGKNMFFMPHMITIDKQNCVWVTDVAMHQVPTFCLSQKGFRTERFTFQHIYISGL